MKPRRVQVGYQKDEGFTLTVEEYSRFRSFVASLGDNLCALTGHRWCNSGITGWAMNQDWKHSKDLVKIPITREEADRINPNSWGWLDED